LPWFARKTENWFLKVMSLGPGMGWEQSLRSQRSKVI